MRKLTLVIPIVLLVSGCQTSDVSLTTSSTPVAVTGAAAGAIAGDMASRLAEQIGPAGETTIKLENDTTDYAAALEAALKEWGYTVITDKESGKDQTPVEVSYSLNIIDGQILAQLTTSSVSLGRAYTATAGGAAPSSPLSILQRN